MSKNHLASHSEKEMFLADMTNTQLLLNFKFDCRTKRKNWLID